MKNFCLLIFFVFMISCGRSYDTLQTRDRDFKANKIQLSTNNLSAEQIKHILNTKITKNFPVDLSLVIKKDYYVTESDEFLFTKTMITSMKKIEKIKRIVPIPEFITPEKLDFSTIQELGVRALTEYIILFDFSSNRYFNWHFISPSEVTLTSTIDYLVIDSQTGAIVASDKLQSYKTYKRNLFTDGNYEKVKKEFFISQGEELGNKLGELFGGM